MKAEPISVTDVARNFADCLNWAHYQGTTFVLLKNGKPFARLVPDGEKVHTAGELAKALSKVELTVEEFKSWGTTCGRHAKRSSRNPTNGDNGRFRCNLRGERPQFRLNGWLWSRSGEQVEVAAITIAILWHGIERADAAHRVKRENIYGPPSKVFPLFHTLKRRPSNTHAFGLRGRAGRKVGDYDLIVAATALERGSSLATFNLRHFENVPGLKLIEPKL